MTWISLLKNKSDLCQTFLVFHGMVKTQYKKEMQVFQWDNEREFVNTCIEDILRRHGIRHQTSCTYNPQQNGLAERKIDK